MIPLSALGGARPPGADGGAAPTAPAAPKAGMVSLSSLGGGLGGAPPSMAPPSMAPPDMAPPSMVPPPGGGMPDLKAPAQPEASNDTLAEVGKTAKERFDVLMPIAIPSDAENSRPVPKQVQCLDNGTDLFKMFEVDMNRFDAKAVRKGYHKMAAFVHPEKLGREPNEADHARFTKLKQAYTVIMDEQLRAVYRQHCFGIAGSGGCAPQGHEAALAKSLEMGRDLRKMGEERAIVLHKAAETGWTDVKKDSDGRAMRGDGRKQAHKFNLFADISSEEDDAELEKERRGLSMDEILERSPKYADSFLEKVRPLLTDPKVSLSAAGGAFTMHEEPKLLALLQESAKTIQKILRRCRNAVKQMNWAMTSLLQHKDSPWRGLEVKGSLAEHGCVKLLEIIRSGLAFGKFSEVHEEEFAKLVDNLHRLYMDIFERRGQELLKASIKVELDTIYLLPESGGRLPEGTRVLLQDLNSRADLNGKAGIITKWDFSLQRYTVELEKEDKKKETEDAPANPDMFGLEDVDDADEEEEQQDSNALQLVIPKKLMVLRKNVLVDLNPPKKHLEDLVKNWNAWRKRPRSVSASQDAEAVAAALGPPLESMATFLQEAAQAVSTGSATGKDGAELIADECRQALAGARNLASKLLGEEPEEPPAPPPLNEPAPALVPFTGDTAESRALKEAAEVAQAAIEINKEKKKKKKKDRSRSRKRKKKRSSSSSSSGDKKKKKKKD